MAFSAQSWLKAFFFDRQVTGGLCVLIVAGFLLTAWWPFEPFPENRVTWLPNQPGIGFRPHALVYDEQPLSGFPGGTQPAVYTIVIDLEAAFEPNNNVYHILTLNNGRLPSPFVLCQWKAHLVIRTPDATGPRGFREAAVEGLPAGKRRRIIIVSNGTGTTFYVEGKSAARYPRYVVPAEAMRGQLILGNAASGKQSWSGKVFGLNLYSRALNAEELRAYGVAGGSRDGTAPTSEDLVASYTFNEGAGDLIQDHSLHRHRLTIPPRYRVLRTPVLRIPSRKMETLRAAGISDVIANLVGFIPFGFLLYQYRSLVAPGRWWWRLVVVTLVGAVLSTTIELVQVWLPTRDSSALDILFNAIGTLFGASVAVVFCGLATRWAPPGAPPVVARGTT